MPAARTRPACSDVRSAAGFEWLRCVKKIFALSLAGSGSAVGETALVPISAVVLTLSGWRPAYIVLGLILLLGIIPLSYALLSLWSRSRPGTQDAEEEGLSEYLASKSGSGKPACAWMPDDGLSLRQAVKTRMFWALTLGFFT